MNILIIFLSFLWMVRIVCNIFSWTSLWWIKEYRWDRMRIHLKTKQGKKILFPSFRLPPRSFRSLSVVAVSILLLSVLYMFTDRSILSILFIDLLSFPMTAGVVFLSYLPMSAYHLWQIFQASAIMRKRTDLLVIGITGSYGKTSTKEYLSTILSEFVPTLKTEASKNSPIGIAEVILKNLKPEHKIFVVEMGAYKLGEISAMCRMVRPQIGIILAINPQHQDLFGTIETTMKAKYELVENLSGKNIVILNYDDSRVRTLSEWAMRDGKKVWSVRRKEKGKIGEDREAFEISNSTPTKSRLSFEIIHNDESLDVSASVVGEHQAINIACAIAAVVAAGMPMDKAVRAVKLIHPVSHVLEEKLGIHDSVFIDDTFNNNPDAAKAAIAVLAMYEKRKILVFAPMIELGTYAQSSHYDVGQTAAKVCDEVILVGEDWAEDFIKGVRSAETNCVVQVLSVDKAATYLRTHIKSKDTVLFKGKSPGLVLSRII